MFCFFFFFQAEDGIRDVAVTGVQTCALPISFMKRAARGLTRINAFGEEMPNVENRVEPASDKDEFGMPLGRIIHSYDEDVARVWNANFEEGLKIANGAGAKETWSGRGAIPTIHLMGGTIMGTGAGNSVDRKSVV